MASGPHIEFRLLGPLEVAVEGNQVALGPPQQRALLALLLLNANEVVSRDRIIDELWGERPPATAAKLVQVYVSALRKLLEPGRGGGPNSILITRSPGYMLQADPSALDLHRLERLLDDGRAALSGGAYGTAREYFGQALELWRGPPLADFAFAEFAQAAIARLEDLRLGALVDRIEADLALGRGDVVGELEALIAEHPLQERLRGQLMLALYRAGRQAEALATYQEARRALVDELGIEPSRALRELEQAILNQESSLDRDPAVEAPPLVTAGGLVGRERELAKLEAALEEALTRSARLVLVAGEPGIGKSRLADELIQRARSRNTRVLVGRCWEAGGAPAYWPWVDALRPYLRESESNALRTQLGRGATDMAAVFPEVRELWPDLPASPASDSAGARFQLLESFASFLRNAASEQPIALVLDDLQAADAPSLLLLRFLSGQLTGAPILIVGCYRDTEVGPDLEEALAELSREPAVHRLSLKGLKESDTSRLLESITGDAPADDLAEQVHAETQGNPLFATEIGRLLASEGSGPRAPGALRIPEGIREAIGRRLGRQSDRCREVLALGSVVGREFDPEVIRRVSGLEQDELFAALDEAATARLVDGAPETGGRLRFSHILIRDSLYENLSAPRRLRLHFEIAESLEALYEGNPEPHLAELAHHYLHAGTSVASKAIDYAERAGDRAASQYAYEEAARHYSSAIQGLETIGSGSAERTCELLLSLGDVLSRAGTKEKSRAAVRRAAELAEEIGRPDQLARAALQYGGRFAWARGASNPGLVPLLERALAAVGDDDSQTRVKLLARLASASRDEPLRERRVRLADEALAIARREGDPATLAIALDGHWVATEGPDDTGHGITVGEELIGLGEKLDDAERVFAGHAHRLHNFWELGDRAAVDFELDALRKLASELDQLPQRWHLGADEAMLALLEGRFEDAEQLISQTLALGQLAESWNAVVTERLSRFVLRRAQGRLEELTDTIARSVHEYQTLPRFRCALAHLYAEVGREDDARAAFDAVLSRHIGREQFDAESLFTMTLLADPCAFLGDEDAATQLHSLLLPYEHLYARAPVEVGFGSVARALGVLATTLCHYDDAERHFGVAIEMERRMRARPWLAHAQHDFAAMLLARGTAADEKRAAGLLNDAVAAYRELGMETWAARAAALS